MRFLGARIVLVGFSLLAWSVRGLAASPGSEIEFNRDIRPILADACYACHGPDAAARKAGLRFDIEGVAKAVLESDERAIVPWEPEKSELIRRITSDDADVRMPPPESKKQLTDHQRELLRRWIKNGANWQGHWAYQPIRRPEVPLSAKANIARGAIDAFILARLDREGLSSSPAADRITLLRRLAFDLNGLPPSLAEVEAFAVDERPDAFEREVDRRLASPRYGERMAVYWLDLVRYADSCGYHSDIEQPISPYRDYVIAALNADMPFDQFTREQLAGDLLPNPTIAQRVATGYNRLNKTTEEGGAQAGEYLEKYAADRVRTTAGVWLSATLGCAECHDHKYDPFTTKDFYSFAAIFADVKEVGVYEGSGSRREPELLLPTAEQQRDLDALDARVATLDAELKDAPTKKLANDAVAALKKQRTETIARRRAFEKNVNRTMITVAVRPREMRILPRGNWLDRTGPIVEAAPPASLPQLPRREGRFSRLDLANWLVARENPLVSRVLANRLWKLFHGVGLSKQLDDFGVQGEWPTHPLLLDHLASELLDSGWDMKRLVRSLTTSHAYRQTSVPSDELLRRDPLNRLCARQGRWRLDAEMVRDNALSTAGLLVGRIGGPSVRPYQPAGYWKHLNFPPRDWKADVGENQYRRGLYTHWQRTFLHPSMLAFDATPREECTAERAISSTPKAALALLNDPTYVEAARSLAIRTIRLGGAAGADRMQFAWRTVLSRRPSDAERDVLLALLAEHLAHYRANRAAAAELLKEGQLPTPTDLEVTEVAAWSSVARTLYNLQETMTRN